MITTTWGTDGHAAARFVERTVPASARGLRVDVRQLRGGLVSPSVLMVFARYSDDAGTARSRRFVLKRLDGSAVREARIYQDVLRTRLSGLAPELYDVYNGESGLVHLCLEAVVTQTAWPWGDTKHAVRVLERIADLHQLDTLAGELEDWDYDAELAEASRETIDAAERYHSAFRPASMRRSLVVLKRIQAALPRIRRQLLLHPTLPKTIVHGDLHPGNVLVRRRRGALEPVLLDWARARPGSPLEDVASWLQWLGFWEPEARRKHDTLFGKYLSARGLSRAPTNELRQAYWLAAAVNCYSGALTYHLSVASEPGLPEGQRATSVRAINDCLRVLRRADAYWSS